MLAVRMAVIVRMARRCCRDRARRVGVAVRVGCEVSYEEDADYRDCGYQRRDELLAAGRVEVAELGDQVDECDVEHHPDRDRHRVDVDVVDRGAEEMSADCSYVGG